MQSDDLLTARFQSNIPFVVPAPLRALHTQRNKTLGSASLEASLYASHCTSCGSSSFCTRSVRASVQSTRSKDGARKTLARYVLRDCEGCGASTKVPVSGAAAVVFPRRKQSRTTDSGVKKDTPPTTSSVHEAKYLPAPKPTHIETVPQQKQVQQSKVSSSTSKFSIPTPSSTKELLEQTTKKSKSKKKGGLQELLSRNRAQEKEAQQKKRMGNSLGDFLSSLS